MTNTSTLTLIKQILDEEMNLPTGRCFAYNGAEDLPKDSGLFIVLFFGNRTPYANNIKYEYTATGIKGIQSYNVSETVQIAVISRNTEARERSHEVYMALNSIFSQQLQEQYHFHISTTGEVLDNSFLEATSRLNRFDVTCTVIRSYEKEKPVDYYDKFPLTSNLDAEWLIE